VPLPAFGEDLTVIRIPSHFWGLYDLKPGSGRISLSGTLGERFSYISPNYARCSPRMQIRAQGSIYPDGIGAHGKDCDRNYFLRDVRKVLLSLGASNDMNTIHS
jgi:hypothetical protein